jgi:hypothetical protein
MKTSRIIESLLMVWLVGNKDNEIVSIPGLRGDKRNFF